MKTDRYTRIRHIGFELIAVIAFGIIAIRLWQLQIVQSETFQLSADRNRFRLVPINAPRGIIFDRSGRALVRNVPSFTVSIIPAGLPKDAEARREVLERLGSLLNMPVSSAPIEPERGDYEAHDSAVPMRGGKGPSIEEILKQRTTSPYAPVRIATNVDRQAAFIIEEEHLKLPGVVVGAEPLRQYVDGPLTAHILGYVGRIPVEQVKAYLADSRHTYRPDDLVGLVGVERTQEHLLRGTEGQKHIEVDAFEREVRVVASRAPVQGHSIKLTIDLELQRVVENALREGMRNANSPVGVAIVLDPRTGEVLAMVSLPSYDNNLFSGGISAEDYEKLLTDRHHPLVNHAIGGQYPPGSTFKLVPASAALEEHVVDRRTMLGCQGILWLPNRYFPDDPSKAQKFYCWNHAGHGMLNIVGGISQSCDIFFYQMTGGYRDFEGLGMERLAKYAHMFGYGEPTGIDLSGEATGLVPTDRWKRLNYDESWLTGDTYNASIGQGYVLATPLQVVNATAAVANGGTLYRPQLIYQVTDAEGRVIRTFVPEVIRKLNISEGNLALVRQGMLEAVTNGTAWLIRLPGVKVAGKTGTAEYPAVDEQGKPIYDKDGNLPTHAWFTAFAPFDKPEIALVVFLEGGGEGSRMAVPVAAQIMRHYFGLPESAPTPTVQAPMPTPTPGAAR